MACGLWAKEFAKGYKRLVKWRTAGWVPEWAKLCDTKKSVWEYRYRQPLKVCT